MKAAMPSAVQTVAALLRAPAAEVGFLLRRSLRWRRGAPQFRGEPKDELFAAAPATAAELAALAEAYALAPLRMAASVSHWLAHLACLRGLARLADAAGVPMPAAADGSVRAIDVGSGDFHYAFALQRWLARHGGGAPRPVDLLGVEVDGHGVYRDGRARADHADAHAALASGDGARVRYEVADFVRRNWPAVDVATAFFPFLSAYACLQWGLPLSRLRPRRFVQRAVATVRPGGWLVVVNQTAAERAELARLLADQPVRLLAEASWRIDFAPWAASTVAQTGTLWARAATG
jgi:hypothetical protein